MESIKRAHSRIRVGAFVCAMLICATSVQADTIYLRNGRIIEGTLVGQTRTRVRIRVGRRIRSYRKKSIRRITYGLDRSEQRRRAAAKKRLEAKRKRLARLRRLARRREAKKRAEAERKRKAEEKRLAEEQKRIAAEKERGKRLAAERALARKKTAAERKRRAEERRIAAEKKREAARIARLEAQVKRDEEAKRKKEEARLKLVAAMRRALKDKEQAVKDREKELEAARKRIAAEKERLRRERELVAEREARQRKIARISNATPEGALWRSAVLPGWGQLYRGGDLKGYGFMGATVALLGAMAATSASVSSARSTYESDPLQFIGFIGQTTFGLDSSTTTTLSIVGLTSRQSSLSTADAAARNASLASALFVGFYIYNLIDAYLFRPALPRALDTVTARSDAGRGTFFFTYTPEPAVKRGYDARGDSLHAGFQMRF